MDAEQNLHNLDYLNNSILVSEILKKWHNEKPDHKELNEVVSAYIKVVFYVTRITQDNAVKESLISKYRYERNKARLELQELKEKYNNLKDL
tara:strand:+ start:1341 stop:1616 length:276 start_codon:yes stop_codon:yes gene_type:complete